MKIAIETQHIFRPNRHGMDFVALESIRELQKRDDGSEYYILITPGGDRCLEESSNLSIAEVKCPDYPLWKQIALPLAVKHLGVDLLYCTSNTAPLWYPVPLVLTLHDIIYLEPHWHRSPSLYQGMGWHYRRLIVPCVLKKCRKIIAVSRFECERINKTLQIPADRITATYNGYSTHFSPLSEVDMHIAQQYVPEKGFLFFLGNTDPRENTERVLKAYSLYLQRSATRRPLFIAGLREEYVDRVLQQEDVADIKRHLYYPEYIPNGHLAVLYNTSFAFLYPSFRKSFDIPLLETMACGTPVVTGNASAMLKMTGSGALTVNPSKPEEIVGRLLQLEQNPILCREQKAYGLQRAQQLSQTRTARELSKVYQSIKI